MKHASSLSGDTSHSYCPLNCPALRSCFLRSTYSDVASAVVSSHMSEARLFMANSTLIVQPIKRTNHCTPKSGYQVSQDLGTSKVDDQVKRTLNDVCQNLREHQHDIAFHIIESPNRPGSTGRSSVMQDKALSPALIGPDQSHKKST